MTQNDTGLNTRQREMLSILRAIAYAPPECADCAVYCEEGHISCPCNGDFPKDCEYRIESEAVE